MQRLAGLFVLALSALAGGCGSPCATTGWRFEVGRPATMQAPAIVHQSSGPVGIAPVATAAGRTGLSYSLDPEPVSSRGPTLAALSSSCTLDDICRMLERIERRLAVPPSAPMPRQP